MKSQNRTKDLLVVSFALFSMFLGAGNIIFPPYMGAMAGSDWTLASLGFVLTGTGLPMLGIIAVAKAGGSAQKFCARVSPIFATVLTTIILTFIGPLFAIPRTAATAVELAILPFMPASIDPNTLLTVGALIFFVICLFFILSPNSVIDRLGAFLTPFLLIFLAIIIGIGIFKPIGEPIAPAPDRMGTGVFHYGFSTGYQTMDALASIVFGGTVAMTLQQKGYEGKSKESIMRKVAGLAGLGTMAVYVGFAWIGASGSGQLQTIPDRTSLTVTAIKLLSGNFGQILLALIIFLACLTTAIGCLLTASDYFTSLFKNRFSYKTVAVTLTLLSYLVSIMGVEGIINLSTPLLEIIYPVVIVLIALNLLGQKLVPYDEVFIGGVIAAIPFGVIQALKTITVTKPTAEEILVHVPLGPQGFAFLIPALLGCIIGWFVGKSRARKAGTLKDQA